MLSGCITTAPTRIRASEIFKPTASTGSCREPVDIRNIDLGTTSLSPGSSYLLYTTVANGVPNGEYDFRVDEINTQNEVIRHAETLSYQVRNKLEFTLSPTVDTANAALGESIDINADFTSGDFVNIYLYGPVGDAAATTQKLSSSFVCTQRLYRFVWTPPRSTKAGTYEVFLRTQDYPVESNRVPVYILNPTASPSPSVSPTPTPTPTPTPLCDPVTQICGGCISGAACPTPSPMLSPSPSATPIVIDCETHPELCPLRRLPLLLSPVLPQRQIQT